MKNWNMEAERLVSLIKLGAHEDGVRLVELALERAEYAGIDIGLKRAADAVNDIFDGKIA